MRIQRSYKEFCEKHEIQELIKSRPEMGQEQPACVRGTEGCYHGDNHPLNGASDCFFRWHIAYEAGFSWNTAIMTNDPYEAIEIFRALDHVHQTVAVFDDLKGEGEPHSVDYIYDEMEVDDD